MLLIGLNQSNWLHQIHARHQLRVGLRPGHPARQQFHGFHRVHVREHLAEDANEAEFIAGEEEFFSAGTRSVDIYGGPDALIDQSTIQVKLGITGAFELFEDHLIHSRVGVHQGGSDDR
jgi:hypothetical protein